MTFTDPGDAVSAALLAAMLDGYTDMGLDSPGAAMQMSGTGIPIEDICDGLTWVRLGTAYPSNGDGNPFAPLRIDFSIPAWVFTIECGVLWCRENILADGNAPDPGYETSIAQRDNAYRAGLMAGIYTHFPPLKPACIDGFRMSPWTPIGPDGGISGGMVVVTVVSETLLAQS